ncbi:MAG TPA: response regulator [Planctomycetota bacterium]|nr:response regulator [Planctomycetota bacterium]
MTTQSFFTPNKAAEVIGCKEEAVLEYIKSGQLKAQFMANIANYVITYNDLMAFLKATRDFKTMQKMLTRRIIVVDRDPKVQDIMRMELGRQGCEVRVATTEREVSFLTDEYQPDVICVHAGATTREKEPVRASLDRARSVYKTYIILYHNFATHFVNSPEVAAQLKAVNADIIVACERSVSALVDAVRTRFGLKVSGNTTVQRKPLT